MIKILHYQEKRATKIEYEVLVIDGAETPVEKPKKAEEILFWKKRHIIKTQREEKSYFSNGLNV